MKSYYPAKALPCFLLLLFYHCNIFSQCPNGAPSSAISYDSVFRGGGNNTYGFNLPQFDTSRIYLSFPQFEPSKGTLISVDIQTVISVINSYKIENQDNAPSLSKIKMIRSDVISSPVLMTPFESTKSKIVAINVLSASDGVYGSGTDYAEASPFYSYKNYPVNYSLTGNLAGFLGTGNVSFNYETQTDLYSSGSNNLFTSFTEDSVSFKLIYHYCTTTLLPADITDFNATKLSSGNVQLSWKAPNEKIGNSYEMQKSADGKNYLPLETIAATPAVTNNYQVKYVPVKDDKDKIFFRIKLYDADGSIKYSIVKTVSLEYVTTAMKVYPTVTKSNVNIYFRYAAKSDYRVSILSLTGQVMQQSEFLRTNFINLTLTSGLKPGLYLVSVINKQTLERQQSKLVIE